MEVIATLPPIYSREAVRYVCKHPNISGVRYNVGARSPYDPSGTIESILEYLDFNLDKLWIDLKGRQLRITKWAVPTYGDIELNHKILVRTPAKIIFRGGEESTITNVVGNKIFVDPPPREAVGAGQAINVHGDNLEILGYLTEEDIEYIRAASSLDVHQYMASFVEDMSDIQSIRELDPKAEIMMKIESEKGVNFALNTHLGLYRTSLMVARDDLLINLKDKTQIIDVMKSFYNLDRNTVIASRILTSCLDGGFVSMGDLADLYVIKELGFKRIMLSDSLCANIPAFLQAMSIINKFYEN